MIEITIEKLNKINQILMILNEDFKDDSKKLITYVEEISQLYSEREPSEIPANFKDDEAKIFYDTDVIQ